MNGIPYGIVRARRTTGVILLVSSLLGVVAVVLLVAGWLTAPPVVHPISVPTFATAPASAPTSVQQLTAGVPSAAAAPGDELASLRAQDASRVSDVPDGYWVPQLASNQVGTDKQGHTWSEAEILADHVARRNAYGGALLWSGDFRTFASGDYWVTVVPSQASSTPGTVLAWCDAEQIDRDHCYAKRLSTSSAYPGNNTKHRP